MKGSRDRTADREAYRNSPVWENMAKAGRQPDAPDVALVGRVGNRLSAAVLVNVAPPTISPDLPPGVNPEDVPT